MITSREKPAVRCLDCEHWCPSLDWFGYPTGRGGCKYRWHNMLGEKLRYCRYYLEPLYWVASVPFRED